MQMQAIPNKLYFRIGEVSDIVGVKPYVLRYWESEFTDIKPTKSKSGQRLYKRRDVELLLKIKELLYEERFTINGARKRLKDFGRGEARETAMPIDVAELEDVEELEEGPRQLEVFQTTGGGNGDDAEALAAPVARRTPPVSASAPASASGRDNTKALLKIRRDLEELLTLIKA